MKSSQTMIEVPATPEYVLDVLLDKSREEFYLESGDLPGSGSVTLDSPFEVLCEACDLKYDINIILSPMAWFGLDYCEWRDALITSEVDTVRDFCELIAARTTMPRIQLVSICGQTCQPASVFLAVRSLLQNAGADVREIAPSTSLKEFTRYYTETFLGPIAKLAPGALPDVDIDDGGKFRREMIKASGAFPC